MPQVESHGTRIWFEEHGSGPAVVFAHGMGGNGMIWWQQVPHFARRQRVVTFDHRGFARSPCAPEQFRPDWFADDLLAVLDQLGIERAALVCQSMGGWTGLKTALRAPERVACLVLCATPGSLATPKVREALGRIGASLAQAGGVRGPLALAPDFPEREPERTLLYEQISGLNPGLPPEALVRLSDPATSTSPEDLADYAVPTLVVACQHDQLFPPDAIHEVAAAIPGAELYDFAGVGHSSYFEDPSTFNQVIGSFVAKHR